MRAFLILNKKKTTIIKTRPQSYEPIFCLLEV